MDNKKNILIKVYLFFVCILLFGVAIVAQIVNIQLFQKEAIIANVSATNSGYKKVKANRGDIYAQDGSLLATSLNYYTVGMDMSSVALIDKNFNENLEALADSLHQLIPEKSAKKFRDELITARKKKVRWYKIKNDMSFLDFERLKNFPLFELGRYKSGLVFSQYVKREKPFGVLASRTIGSKAPFGLEGAFDTYLEGKDGEQFQRKIPGGVWVAIDDRNTIDPVDGYDVCATIDIGIQEIVEEELKKKLFYHQADYGCAVLMEVATGKVRGIANLKIDSLGNYWEDRNYAVGDVVEPGSTFKLASMMALLEDALVTMDEKVDVGYGEYKFYDRKMKDSHLYSERRVMSVKEVFQESSNVGIAKLVVDRYGNQAQNFIDRLYGFGLQSKLGLDIKGEQSPVIKDPSQKDQWSGITLPWSSIGYEVALTPLQMLAFYNAVANNGKMVRPYFVEKIKKNEVEIGVFGTQVLNHKICSDSTLKILNSLLKGVVSEGTAKQAFYKAPYAVSGKTGTAQINYASKKSGEAVEYRASFVGFFPSDQPVYSCIVVITNPKQNGIYGSQVAAPVFRKISDRLFTTCKSLHINIEDIAKHDNKSFLSTILEVTKLNYLIDKFTLSKEQLTETIGLVSVELNNGAFNVRKLSHDDETIVPNVKNMYLSEALFLLENRGLKVEIVGVGKIKNQSIPAGQKIIAGKTIKLILG